MLQNYDAIRPGKVWPPYLGVQLLVNPFASTGHHCPSQCPQYTTDDVQGLTAHLPLCPSRQSPPGSWAPSPEIVATTSAASLTAPHEWEWGLFPAYAWVPTGCRLEPVSINNTANWIDRAKLFGQKRALLIIGDSHTRMLYDS
jgi:hypothetical protein